MLERVSCLALAYLRHRVEARRGLGIDRDRTQGRDEAVGARQRQAANRYPVHWAQQNDAADKRSTGTKPRIRARGDRPGIDISRVRDDERLRPLRVSSGGPGRGIEQRAYARLERGRRAGIEQAGYGGRTDCEHWLPYRSTFKATAAKSGQFRSKQAPPAVIVAPPRPLCTLLLFGLLCGSQRDFPVGHVA